jgi:O-antigen ligase
LSSRLNLWKNATRMLADNPGNGVGPRGFRYAYRDYADPDDPFLDNTAATYAHQMLLELGSESGVPGLVGYLLAMALLLRSWWRASGPQRTAAIAWALALLGIFFPVNTHLATYSSFWGQVIWWLVALYVVAISTRGGPPVDRARD